MKILYCYYCHVFVVFCSIVLLLMIFGYINIVITQVQALEPWRLRQRIRQRMRTKSPSSFCGRAATRIGDPSPKKYGMPLNPKPKPWTPKLQTRLSTFMSSLFRDPGIKSDATVVQTVWAIGAFCFPETPFRFQGGWCLNYVTPPKPWPLTSLRDIGTPILGSTTHWGWSSTASSQGEELHLLGGFLI